jgi:hypothetical protein
VSEAPGSHAQTRAVPNHDQNIDERKHHKHQRHQAVPYWLLSVLCFTLGNHIATLLAQVSLRLVLIPVRRAARQRRPTAGLALSPDKQRPDFARLTLAGGVVVYSKPGARNCMVGGRFRDTALGATLVADTKLEEFVTARRALAAFGLVTGFALAHVHVDGAQDCRG